MKKQPLVELSLSSFEIASNGSGDFNEPVDLVYTWVDDSDADWRAARSHWADKFNCTQLPSKRFSDNGELRYSLRSVAKFAPWFRKIFIVTANQTPDWLDLSHEKIQLVSHEDIYQESDHLPTFNSLSIETHLDRIPGLSEHYVYMNDDFFFGKMIHKGDFFNDEGKIIARLNLNSYPTEKTPANCHWKWLWAIENSDRILNKAFRPERRPLMSHQAFPQKKSLHQKLRSTAVEAFQACSEQKFRSESDIMLQWYLAPYFALYAGKAVCLPTGPTMSFGYCDLSEDVKDVQQKTGKIAKRRPKFFCLNNGTPERPEGLACGIELLKGLFPEPGEFEKEALSCSPA